MYRIFDILVASDLPLPELPEKESGPATISFSLGSQKEYGKQEPIWFHTWSDPAGQIYISCARLRDSSYLIRYPGLADFHITSALDAVHINPAPKTPTETLQHLILDQIVPRILGQLGRLVLHASAIKLKGNIGIAFLGSSGWGKSTLATSFIQSGSHLITDDCLLMESRKGNAIGIPSYYGTRLYSDSTDELFKTPPAWSKVSHYSNKKRLVLPEQTASEAAVYIDALFLLDHPDRKMKQKNIEIKQVKGAEAIMSMIRRTFLIDVKRMDIAAKLFFCAGAIESCGVPIFSLSFPRTYTALPDVHKAIRATL